jgi:hypothetical protein
MSGRSGATPYVVFGGVMAFLVVFVLLGTLVWLVVTTLA